MKRHLVLLIFLLALSLPIGAKTRTNNPVKNTRVCLTIQAENGSIKQKVNEDGTITCTIKPNDLIRVSSILLNGEDVTNQMEKNKLDLPLLTENATLEVSFESISNYPQMVYRTIAMN